MRIRKIYVDGRSGSGKSALIKAASHFPLQAVRKKLSHPEVALRLDYGRLSVPGNLVYLYAPMAGRLISTEWARVVKEMSGAIYVIDGCAMSVTVDVAAIEEYLEAGVSVLPYVNGIGKREFREESYLNLVKSLGDRVEIHLGDVAERSASLKAVTSLVEEIERLELSRLGGES